MSKLPQLFTESGYFKNPAPISNRENRYFYNAANRAARSNNLPIDHQGIDD